MSDLIRREDVVEALYQAIRTTLTGTFADSMSLAIAMVNNLPSAEPERNKGEWNFIGDNMFECTHCGVVYTTQQLNGLRNYAVDPYTPRFCPNCGADMRSDDE